MKKQILGMTALSIQLLSPAASGVEHTDLGTLKMKCREAQQYSQNNFKIVSQFHCTETRTLWAKDTKTLSLKNMGTVGYKIDVKGQLQSDLIKGPFSVADETLSCPVLQQVNVTATASPNLTCEELNKISDERTYCAELLQDKWADCTAEVAIGSVPFKTPKASACEYEVTSNIKSCVEDPTSSSSSQIAVCADTSSSSSSSDFCDKVKRAEQKVEKAIVSGAQAVGDAVVDGAQAVGDAVVDGAKGVGKGINAVGKAIKQLGDSSSDSSSDGLRLVSTYAPVNLGASVKSEKVSRLGGLTGSRAVQITSEPQAGSLLAKCGLTNTNVVWSVDSIRVKTEADLSRALNLAKSRGVAEIHYQSLSGKWEKRKVNLM